MTRSPWLLLLLIAIALLLISGLAIAPTERTIAYPPVVDGSARSTDHLLASCEHHTASAAEAVSELSSPIQPTPQSQGSAGEAPRLPTDSEWESFKRTRTSLSGFVAGATTTTLREEWLLRNIHLNPRDVYIPPEHRHTLTTVLEILRPRLDAGFNARMAIYARDLERLIREGGAKSVGRPLKKTVRTQDGSKEILIVPPTALKGLEVDMYSIRDGEVFTAGRKDLPQSRIAIEQERFLEMELAAGLTQWFLAAGTLERWEVEELLNKHAAGH